MVNMTAAYHALDCILNRIDRNVCGQFCGNESCEYRVQVDDDAYMCGVTKILKDVQDTMNYQEELLKNATGITWQDGRPLLPHEEEPKGKHNSIGYEQLEKVLMDAGVLNAKRAAWEYDCERIFECEALGQPFEIEWWCNLSYLRINGTLILFHWVHITDTWPGDNIRKELKFQNIPDKFMKSGDIVAILPLEYWQKD